jgi:formylglycine-generating enzyme required for sulfatase activity
VGEGKLRLGGGDAMPDQTDPTGKTFEARIRGLLELLGYRVQHDRLVAGRQTDLVAVKDVFPSRVLYLVECKDYSRPVGVDVISDVENRLKAAAREGKYPDAQAWVVARSGFTSEARDYAEPLRIVCSTPDDLIRSLIDFAPYLNDLIHDFQGFVVDRERRLKLPQLYVEPDAFYEYLQRAEPLPAPTKRPTKVGPLQTLVDEWLADPELNQLTLLGDYGTGKTVFTLKLAHDLAQAYLDGQEALIPVRIPLKEFDPKQEVDDLVMNHLRRHGLEGSPYAAFQYLLRQGMLLLILDGFDEITAQVTPELTRRNFDKLDALVDERARVLLTCRTHYFRDRPEMEALLERRAGLPEMGTRQGTELYQAIVGRPNYRILYLREFDEPQIVEYLQKACGDEWERDWETIRSLYNLWDLARRPVLLDMVVKSLPQLRERKGEVTAAGLYDVYTGYWIHRDDWRAILTPAGKAAFTEELAWRLWTANRERLHYAELTDLAQELLRGEHFKPGAVSATALSQADIEYAAHEVRTAAFLTRDAAGNYGFAHRSFMEFFVARRLARGLLRPEPVEGLDGSAPEVTISEAIRGFITQLIGGQMPEYEAVEVPEGMIYVPPGPFVMGAEDERGGTRIVRLGEGFFIGRYPVTNAQYQRFVEARGYEEREYWKDEGWQWKQREGWTEPRFWDDPEWNQPDQPVVGVSWYEAEAYARWAGGRLPIEQEWEKAARGIDGRQYPWGDGFDPGRCNTDESDIKKTTPVGKYSPDGDSPYGLADMAGNVWEWCTDWYDKRKDTKVLRGGSWFINQRDARCSFRSRGNPHLRGGSVGFRVSRGSSSS